MKKDEQEADRRRAEEIEAAWLEYESATEPTHKLRQGWRLKHFEAQAGHCKYCRTRMHFQHAQWDRMATIDHVVPLGNGGEDSFDNTVAACFACNQEKADLSLTEFLSSEWLWRRKESVHRPPDRLSVFKTSSYYNQEALDRGVVVIFRNKARSDVWEYCRSKQWIKVPAGRAKDRSGNPILIKLRGPLRVHFEDGYDSDE